MSRATSIDKSSDAYQRKLEGSRRWKGENKERRDAYRKAYYHENKDRERIATEKWKNDNLERYKETKSLAGKRYYDENRDKFKEYKRSNRSAINTWHRNRYHSNSAVCIDKRLRATLTQALRLADVKKTVTTLDLVGIPAQELKKYIESKFLEGMSWENRKEWHIDHIRPCASFNLLDEAEQRECFHYTNLQPLWKEENFKKRSHYNGKHHRHSDKKTIPTTTSKDISTDSI